MKSHSPRPSRRRRIARKEVHRLHLAIRADIIGIIGRHRLRRMVHRVAATMVRRRLRHRPGNKPRNFNFLLRPIAKHRSSIATTMKFWIYRKSIEKDNFH
jgi:hypothetical protein